MIDRYVTQDKQAISAHEQVPCQLIVCSESQSTSEVRKKIRNTKLTVMV